jgi:tripartite-type tricarboxylate transporter receptor subunit TctC
MKRNILACLSLWASALFLTVSSAAAASAYPSKPIRIILPFGPGSSTDVIMRIIIAPLAKSLGTTVYVDPKPGADGAIAALEVARAAPDGYTLGVGSGSPMAAVPYLRKNPPYDPVKDFTPITDLGRFTVFLYVNSALPVHTFQQFVDYVRRSPGKLSYATGNASGIVAFAQLCTLTGMKMLSVPYKSAPPAMMDLVAHRVDAMMDPPTTALPYVRKGQLRALVTTLKSRSPLLPDVPTIYEAGVPQFSITNWMGLIGPAGMPADIVDRLNKAFGEALRDPQVQAQLQQQAFMSNPSTPAEFGDLIKEQERSYAELLEKSGFKPQ